MPWELPVNGLEATDLWELYVNSGTPGRADRPSTTAQSSQEDAADRLPNGRTRTDWCGNHDQMNVRPGERSAVTSVAQSECGYK